MKVSKTASPRAPKPRPRSRNRLRLAVIALAVAALLAAYSGLLVGLGMVLFRASISDSSGQAPSISFRAVPERLLAASKNHLEAMRRNEPFERLHLDIKFKHLEKLRGKRREAMDAGVLMASNEDFVPATIRFAGRSIDTKVRLKGDALDHLSGDKWSFRVKVKSNAQLFGMRRFSIQAPKVRDFQAEPIYLAHLRREGVLTPRYEFVEVTVNGKDIGVMAVEEHFSKELLESQRRREGVIIRFDEDGFWRNLSLNGTFGPFGNPHTAMLTPFEGSKTAESQALSDDLATATGLMRGFLAGTLPAGDVFELELMARFMAVSEVWRTYHPLAWHNVRFYFNPLTTRLEPIGFDGNAQALIFEPGLVTNRGDFTPMLLADAEYRDVFIRNLARIAGDMADGSLVARARAQEADIVPRLQEGFEYIEPMRFDALMSRAQNLAKISPENFDFFLPPLGDLDMQFPEPIKAYLCQNCSLPRLEFENVLPVPVEVLSIRLTKKPHTPPGTIEPVLASGFPLEIPPTKPMQPPVPVYVAIDPASQPDQFDIDIVVRVVGQERRHTVSVAPYFDVAKASPIPSATLAEALAQHSFLSVSPGGDALVVAPGTWAVQGPLVMPKGMALDISAGTELQFAEDGIVISTGPLHFEGTAERPIRLAPRAGAETWGGLISVQAATPHVWKHVVVQSTKGINLKGWRLTGGITLRAAEIQISDSLFAGHRGEDALNMIRSRFELSGVEFRDTFSDALDADFSDGVIRGGRFNQIGGDGIDVSGAKIEVDGTVLTAISDKAISVGEASQLTARNVRIEGTATGAASKDGSDLTLEDSSIADATTAGVSVFTKKPVYGPARARLIRVKMDNVATEVLVQMGSHATVDGVAAAEQPFDTDTLY